MWYRSITRDAQFPAAVQRLVCSVVAAAAVRVRALNLGALLIRDTCDVLAEHLDLYRRVRDRRAFPQRDTHTSPNTRNHAPALWH